MKSLLPLSGFILIPIVIAVQAFSSLLIDLLPRRSLEVIYRYFTTKKREEKFYESFFKVKKWKDHIPSLGPFNKGHLERKDGNYLKKYLLENLRAELCHITAIILLLSLNFISVKSAHWKITLWAFFFNLPCIVIQRYNRPRIERLLKKQEKCI